MSGAMAEQTKSAKRIHACALLTLAATFLLVCSGGIVTSKGVGMSVPDWPTTYGYNMFLFPFSKWVGGIFYEHSHRLIASLLCMAGILAVVTSGRFLRGEWDFFNPDPVLRNLALATTALVFLQLGIGATMRHEHAGLSIPDFPTAYGKWLPDTSPEAIASINATRSTEGQVPTNALYIWVQMAHRAVAFLILAGVIAVFQRAASSSRLRVTKFWSLVWMVLVMLQVTLGALTIWSNKSVQVATAHMALGALTLLLGVLFSFRLCRSVGAERFRMSDPAISAAQASGSA